MAILVVGALVTAFALRASGASKLKAQLDRVRLAGDPLMPADMASPPASQGSDPAAWLSRAALVRDRWDLGTLSDPARYGPLLERARAREFGDDARVAFEELESTLRPLVTENADPIGTWNSFWITLAARLAECNGLPEWDPPSRAAVRLVALGVDPSWQLARTANGVAPIDAQRVAMSLDQADASTPRLPMVEEARLADAANVVALSAALDGRAADALDGVRAGIAMARIHSPPPFLVAHTLRVHHLSRALDTLQMILPRLPRGLPVEDLELAFTTSFPRDDLSRGLSGERAFGHRVFESLRAGWRPLDAPVLAGDTALERFQVRWIGDADHARYLEAMTDTIAAVEPIAHARRALPERPSRTFWTPNARVLVPDVAATLHLTDLLEARLAMARVALTAYRGGAKDALSALSKSVDPYDGQPLRCSLGQEGIIVLWSAGPNGRDEDALDASDDVVWGLRLTE